MSKNTLTKVIIGVVAIAISAFAGVAKFIEVNEVALPGCDSEQVKAFALENFNDDDPFNGLTEFTELKSVQEIEYNNGSRLCKGDAIANKTFQGKDFIISIGYEVSWYSKEEQLFSVAYEVLPNHMQTMQTAR